MFTYFTTPFQCNYSLHNARTFCTFFSLFFTILRRITLPTRAWAFQGSDFPLKIFFDFFFMLIISSYRRQTWFFIFFFPIVDPCPTTASWRSCWSRSGARSRGTPEPQKVFSDFQDSEPVSLNHTTYPAVPLCFRVLVHFPLFLYQPIPTEF